MFSKNFPHVLSCFHPKEKFKYFIPKNLLRINVFIFFAKHQMALADTFRIYYLIRVLGVCQNLIFLLNTSFVKVELSLKIGCSKKIEVKLSFLVPINN